MNDWRRDREARRKAWALLREPLVQFLILGSLLFLLYKPPGNGGPGTNRSVPSHAPTGLLAEGFTRTWNLPPQQFKLNGFMDYNANEETAAHAAFAVGLNEEDSIDLRQRLRQTAEFSAKESLSAKPVSEEELQAWLTQHPSAFLSQPRIAIRHVYFSRGRRGASARTEAAESILALLRSGADVDISELGDPSLLPSELPLTPLRNAIRVFGEAFAEHLMQLETGEWSGPIESTFGLHIAFVESTEPGRQLPLATIRDLVQREVLAERWKKETGRLYDRLLERQLVSIEAPHGPEDLNLAGALALD